MKKEIAKFLVLLLVAVGAGPAGAAIWSWSTTASSNATADPSINWSEGMAPSAVNDSARAMMAATAAWRNDISGVNTTTGTSTAYVLTTSEGVDTTPANGQMLAFIAHATNGSSPTLRADGGTAFPIWFNGASAGAGTLVAGTPYRVAFSLANSAWLLEAGYGNPYGTPLGGLMPYTLTTVPNSNFVFPAGQCLSTTTYATYWVALGSPASGSCGGGQFRIIDLSGRAPVGLDTMPGFSAANRLTASANGCGTAITSVGASCANGTQSQTLAISNLPPYTPAGSVSGTAAAPGGRAIVSDTGGFVSSNATGGTRGQFADINAIFRESAIAVTATLSGTPMGGTSTPIPSVMPVVGVTYLLRVL